MRTQRTTKYSSQIAHNQYGIYNWFRLKGINNKDTMKETIHNFCQDNGYDMKDFHFAKYRETQILNWVQNRFKKFTVYAGDFLKENNYIPISHQKV